MNDTLDVVTSKKESRKEVHQVSSALNFLDFQDVASNYRTPSNNPGAQIYKFCLKITKISITKCHRTSGTKEI